MPQTRVQDVLAGEDTVDGDRLQDRLGTLDTQLDVFHEYSVPDGEIDGLPITAKDAICVDGFTATAGSAILDGYEPGFDATAVRRLREQNCRPVGKTNQDEFGFGTFSMNSAYGVPKNPYDQDRTAGGSSGGAAAITAALDMPHVALGESTGGSISCPAAFSGAVGLTPTYGRVSRYGLIDYANSLDKIGPMARSVRDAAAVLERIAGRDERDFTTADREVPAFASAERDLSDIHIGVPEEYMEYEGVDDRVRETVWDSIKEMEARGATYETVSLPKIAKDHALPSYYITAVSEASTNLARYAGMRYGLESDPEQQGFDEYFSEIRTEGFGMEAKRRILLGHFARQAGYREAYYMQALKVRRLVIEEFKRGFKEFDLLAAPTMPIPAPAFDAAEDLAPEEVYAMDTLTVGPNLAGLPQLSLPVGTVEDMPVGLHLLSDHFDEATLVGVGSAYEDQIGFIDPPDV